MLSKSLLAAALLAASSHLAFAQDTPPPPAPPSADGTPPGMDEPDAKGRPPRPEGRNRPGPMREGASFDLRLGRGMGLRVDCGPQPIAACINAAQPLIDQMKAMPDAPPPPPPPGGPDAAPGAPSRT